MGILRSIDKKRRKPGNKGAPPAPYRFNVRVRLTFAGTKETDTKDLDVIAKSGKLLLVDWLPNVYNELRRYAGDGNLNTMFTGINLVGIKDQNDKLWTADEIETEKSAAAFIAKFPDTDQQ